MRVCIRTWSQTQPSPRELAEKVADAIAVPARGCAKAPFAAINDQDAEKNKGDEEVEHGDDKGGDEHWALVSQKV